jgi:hypothetical protein
LNVDTFLTLAKMQEMDREMRLLTRKGDYDSYVEVAKRFDEIQSRLLKGLLKQSRSGIDVRASLLAVARQSEMHSKHSGSEP